jgi:hypothetical protein
VRLVSGNSDKHHVEERPRKFAKKLPKSKLEPAAEIN